MKEQTIILGWKECFCSKLSCLNPFICPSTALFEIKIRKNDAIYSCIGFKFEIYASVLACKHIWIGAFVEGWCKHIF